MEYRVRECACFPEKSDYNSSRVALPDSERQFFVHTDASKFAIGAVLVQRDENGMVNPTHFASRKLQEPGKKYSTFEREALAVTFARKKVRPYLLGSPFAVFPDYWSIQKTFSTKKVDKRLAIWLNIMAEYVVEGRHRPGAQNATAYYLPQAGVENVDGTSSREAQKGGKVKTFGWRNREVY